MTKRDYKAGRDRGQASFLPPRLEDYIAADNPVRALDGYVDTLDLQALGFQDLSSARAAASRLADFAYDAGADLYRCPAGEALRPIAAKRHQGGKVLSAITAAVSCAVAARCGRGVSHPKATGARSNTGSMKRSSNATRRACNAALPP